MNANIILPKTKTCVIITGRNLYINSTFCELLQSKLGNE